MDEDVCPDNVFCVVLITSLSVVGWTNETHMKRYGFCRKSLYNTNNVILCASAIIIDLTPYCVSWAVALSNSIWTIGGGSKGLRSTEEHRKSVSMRMLDRCFKYLFHY